MPTQDIRDHIRDGEIASAGPLTADATLCFIGRIETPWPSRTDCPRQGDAAAGPLCRLRLDPRWTAALDGIDHQDRLQVLYWMHEARRDLVRLSPGSHAEPRGPFALRAPTRPNPIASSIVALVAREGATLVVRGLDCLDGTPAARYQAVAGLTAASFGAGSFSRPINCALDNVRL